VRRRHRPVQLLFGARAVLLVRQQQGDLSVVMVPAAEERQALDVVPVQVSEQDGPGKRLTVQQPRDPADSRSGVENDRRRRIVNGRRQRRKCDRRSGRSPGQARASTRGHRRNSAAPANRSHTGVFGIPRSDIGS
jgi:hypothetical protein